MRSPNWSTLFRAQWIVLRANGLTDTPEGREIRSWLALFEPDFLEKHS